MYKMSLKAQYLLYRENKTTFCIENIHKTRYFYGNNEYIYICCINVRYCLTIRKIIKLWSRINICNILCTVFSDNNTPINVQTGLTNRLANNTNNTRLERTGRRVRRVTSAQLLKKHCLSCCLHDKA